MRWVVCALLCSACGGDPPLPEGTCGSSYDCPVEGETCLDGTCVPLSAVFPDGGMDAGSDAGMRSDGGIDAGQGPIAYCPAGQVLRAEMTVVMLRMAMGADYEPPAPTGRCSDAIGHPLQAWIEDAAAQGYIGNCSATDLTLCCPDTVITRAVSATLLLRAVEGPSYTPPALMMSRFVDVPSTHPRVDWVEELAARGATSGCATDAMGIYFCPDEPITRGALAVFAYRLDHTPPDPPVLVGTGTFCDDDGMPFEPFIEGAYEDGLVGACSSACE